MYDQNPLMGIDRFPLGGRLEVRSPVTPELSPVFRTISWNSVIKVGLLGVFYRLVEGDSATPSG